VTGDSIAIVTHDPHCHGAFDRAAAPGIKDGSALAATHHHGAAGLGGCGPGIESDYHVIGMA